MNQLEPCIACAANPGTSSKGKPCKPCKGTGFIGWISPSQLKQFGNQDEGCELQWWFAYVAKAGKPPTTPQQARGLTIHSELEYAVKEGRPITDPVAQRLFDMIRLQGVTVTERVVIGEIDGVFFYAIADLTTGPTLYDYKSGSNPRRYGLTARTLPHDYQAIILSHLVPEAETLAWLYGSTKSADAFPVTIPAELAKANTAGMVARAKDLLATRSGKRLPVANKSNCNAYNSECAYIAYCPMHDNVSTNPFEPEINQMAIDPARLAAARARLGMGAPQATASTPVASEPAAAVTPAPAAAKETPLEAAKRAMREAEAAAAAAEAAEAEATAAAEAEALAQAQAEATAAQQAAAAQQTATPATYAKAPTSRGKMPEAKAREAAEIAGGKYIDVLYVNCAPDGVPTIDAAEIIAEANARVCAAHKVPHYAALEFGQGKPALELAITEVLSETPLSAVVAYRTDALAPFVRAATSIVRALA